MAAKIEFIPGGTVTSPRGFQAGATYAGIKKKADNSLDLGILVSKIPCVAAALFTTNSFVAPPVVLSRKRLKNGNSRALIVNSGCANAGTGETGQADAARMAELAADRLGISPQEVLIASTGVIGRRLPMELIKAALAEITPSADGGHALARAMMTTDTVPKEVAVRVTGGEFTIAGVAKGAGMVHPQLATMLCFLTTDAKVDTAFLARALKKAVAISLNMVSIDGDTSPNDMVLIMANGLAANKAIGHNTELAEAFQQALDRVCAHLAKAIARDGEGATKLIEVSVKGAVTTTQARLAARTVVGSPLVKAAVHGSDPNWGRVLAAAGGSGAQLVESKVDLYFGDTCLVASGRALPFDMERAATALSGCEVSITLNLNLGRARATAWGCDLTQEYVTINSEYTT